MVQEIEGLCGGGVGYSGVNISFTNCSNNGQVVSFPLLLPLLVIQSLQ